MDFYDQFRGEGHTPAEAMQAAAYGVWMHADNTTLGPQARAHPGRVPSHRRCAAGSRTGGPSDRADNGSTTWTPPCAARSSTWPTASTRRCSTSCNGNGASKDSSRPPTPPTCSPPTPAKLRDHGMPAVLADQLNAAARRAAAGEAAEAAHLAGYAGQEHGTATQLAAAPDIATTAVDEHRAGLDQSNTTDGAADLDDLRAAQAERLSRTFPHLTVVQATTPHLAGKREAPIVTTRQRGRAR